MASAGIDLIVPVYLNQRLVFDLVAMLQGGIATVTRVSEAQREAEHTTREVDGKFGLGQALSSLMRISLSAKLGDERQDAVERTYASERVHTPASLLFALRRQLLEGRALRFLDAASPPRPGDLVEFVASLRRNPLLETLEAVVQLVDLGIALSASSRPAHGGKQQRREDAEPDLRQVREQLGAILASLKTDTQDLLADLDSGGWRAVLTVEQCFLSDPSLADLVDGSFRVLGKVIRCVPDPGGSISLLRKTALSRLHPSVLDHLKAAFRALETREFSLPSMDDVEVNGPVFHVLPVAVYA